MFGFLKSSVVLGLGILIGVTFATKACAHPEDCEKCSKCPICSFIEEDIVHHSKEKLVETKKKLEKALTTENLAKMGQKAVQAMTDTLAKIDEKLDSMAEEDTSTNQAR